MDVDTLTLTGSELSSHLKLTKLPRQNNQIPPNEGFRSSGQSTRTEGTQRQLRQQNQATNMPLLNRIIPKRDILIVAKESTLPIASVFYDEIETSFSNLQPFILLITPLDEIILKKQVEDNFKNKRLLKIAHVFFENFKSNDWEERMANTLPSSLELIKKEIPTHPSVLHDLNQRVQYKQNDACRLIKVLCSTALSLKSIIMSTENPVVVDFAIYDISRSILNSVCKEVGVTYRTLIGSRYKEYFLSTDDLGEDIVERMERLDISELDLEACKMEMIEASESRDLLPEHEKEWMINKYSSRKTIYIFTDIAKRFIIYSSRLASIIQTCRKYNITLKQMHEITGPTLATYLNSTIGRAREVIRIWQAGRRFDRPNNYIYFPMPNTVENGERRFNNGYLSERQVIDIIRPYLWNREMIVKDHRSMISDRSWKQEQTLRGIYNVRYVSEWSERYSDVNSTKLMNDAEFTVVLSGTAGLECAIKGKEHIVLGRPLYKRYFEMKGFQYPDAHLLKEYMKGAIRNFSGIVPGELVGQYISRCKKYGHSVNIYECFDNPKIEQNRVRIKELAKYMLKEYGEPKQNEAI